MNELQNGYLTAYYEQNLLLAKTMVVKYTEAATLINEGLAAKYGKGVVNQDDPTTWKYYLNLAGQYHPTDTLMTVVSIDTLETIEFTVENLRIHTATAKAHSYGTRYYNALLYRYPTQEALINGILNPVDLHTAIASPTGTVLGYPDGLVEPNETTLIAELEEYLKLMIKRWYNIQFAMSDNLYCAFYFTQMSLFILPKLMNLRLKRCKTNEAHSFHVRMYLASHQGLDRYLPYMTQKQALWFYRNICHLERNAGKVSQFVTLVEKVLTERGIPLAEYSLRQLDLFQNNYRPTVMARAKPINLDQNVMGVQLQSLDTAYGKELQLADGNQQYLSDNRTKDQFAIETTNSAVTQTKLLDSSMADESNSVPEPFSVVALRQWCFMANRGLYDVVITFKDPKTSEPRSLFAKDAFLYMYYIALSMDGLEMLEIPKYLNMQQRLHPKPSVADLLSVVPTNEYDLTAIAQAILSRQPVITPCYSVSSFYSQVQELTDEAYWHWFLISSQGDMNQRAYVDNMVRRLYGNEVVAIDVGTPYFGPWLHANNLPVYDFDRAQATQILKNIFEAGTGLVVDNARLLKNIQKAMIEMMAQLSSYSVQFAREINTEDIIPLNWPTVRLGNPRSHQEDHREIKNDMSVLDATGHGYSAAHVGMLLDPAIQDNFAVSSYVANAAIDTGSSVLHNAAPSEVYALPSPPMELAITYPGQDVALENATGLPGYTTFDRLPNGVKVTLKSLYN